jgi:hypothetical protein
MKFKQLRQAIAARTCSMIMTLRDIEGWVAKGLQRLRLLDEPAHVILHVRGGRCAQRLEAYVAEGADMTSTGGRCPRVVVTTVSARKPGTFAGTL